MNSRSLAVFFLLILIFGDNLISGADVKIKMVEELALPSGSMHPQEVWDFCVTEDQLVVIPDKIAGNIKIYENRGRGTSLDLIKTIGTKGYGKDGLIKPSICFYNKNEDKLGILDLGIRKIFLYNRVGRVDFKREEIEIPCRGGAYDIQLKDRTLYIAGYKVDTSNKNEVSYSFYAIDLTTPAKPKFLLPSKDFYHFDDSASFGEQFNHKNVESIGIMGSFDIQNNSAYVVWQGDLNILRVNIDSGALGQSFGKQTINYTLPFASQKVVDAYYGSPDGRIPSEKEKMSVVKNVFVASRFLLVVYEGPIKMDGKNIWLQIYDGAGKFRGETSVLGRPGNNKYYFDKNSEFLYILSNSKKEGKNEYVLFKYDLSGN